jgi:hypothetical protein
MPGLVPGIHVLAAPSRKDVDSRDVPSRILPRPFLEGALKAKTLEVLEVIGRSVVGHLSGTAREED